MSKEKNVRPRTTTTTGTTTTATVKVPTTYFVFGKTNYIIMVAGIAMILLGYFLMRGGATDPAHPEIFDAAEKYSTMRITIAPIIIVLGLLVEIAAIMYKSKED